MRITLVGAGELWTALARHWRREPSVQVVPICWEGPDCNGPEALAEALHQGLNNAEVAVLCGRPPDWQLPLAATDAAAPPTAGSEATRNAATDALNDSGTGSVLDNPEAGSGAASDGAAIETLLTLLDELPQLRQVVCLSSIGVHGNAGGAWLNEHDPADPSDDQDRRLLNHEQRLAACRTARRQVCLLRLGNVYAADSGLADRLRRLAGRVVPDTVQQHSHWIHRDDVVGAVSAAVEQRWDGLINLVDDRPLTVAELLAMADAAGGEPPPPCEAADAADRRIGNTRLQQLGYRLRHPRLQLPRLQRIDTALFARVAEQARHSPRRRLNHNFHAEPDTVQRFLNVLQPGTYVRPHRHRRDQPGTGFECFLVLQGALGLLVLDARGELLQLERLSAQGPVRGLELAEDQFHTLVALEPDTVMFELKQGPYVPASDKDFLMSFPAEGTPEANAQEARWRALFTGADTAP